MVFFALQSIQLLHNEDMRSTKYLHPSSYNLVKMQLEERLSSDHLEMLHTECPVLVQQESSKGGIKWLLCLLDRNGTGACTVQGNIWWWKSGMTATKQSSKWAVVNCTRLSLIGMIIYVCIKLCLYMISLLLVDLANMYRLLKPIKSVGPLCQCLESHIRKTGLQMIESLTQDNVSIATQAF